jgi:hypothetical protein
MLATKALASTFSTEPDKSPIDDSMAVVARSSVTIRLWIEVCEGIVLPDVTTWCAALSFALAS